MDAPRNRQPRSMPPQMRRDDGLKRGHRRQAKAAARLPIGRDFVFASLGSVLLVMAALVAWSATSTAQDDTAGQLTKPLKIAVLGDSLTAGYGLPADKSFPAQLQAALQADGLPVTVLNGGVSGDTAAGGLARFEWAVPPDAEALIIELGANDGLRGLPVAQARTALEEIIKKARAREMRILLTGMEAPRGLGTVYTTKFGAMFPELAEKYDTLLYPFFLEGVALERDLNLADGIHPNAKGVAVIVGRIRPAVDALIERVQQQRRRTASDS